MKRFFYRILAILCIILGIIGAVLPVMPTVPFLLAALYFAADDPAIQKFINSNKYLKKYLERYQNEKTLPLYGKIAIITGLSLPLLIAGFFIKEKVYYLIVLIAASATILLCIMHLKK